MLAQVTDTEPHEFIWSLGDTHLYLNHLDIAKQHIEREPQPLPKLTLNKDIKDIFDFTMDDIQIEYYNPLPILNYEVNR